jgi:predicted nucleic acid-binding Zn finger protein
MANRAQKLAVPPPKKKHRAGNPEKKIVKENYNMTECVLNVESWDSLIHVVSCVLEDIASQVLEVRMMLRNKCPWALYISKTSGQRCATFISRSKFKGYHFKSHFNYAICTDLETGKQYKITLGGCTCEDFIAEPPDESGKKPACKHIKALQQLGIELGSSDEPAQADALPATAERISIDEKECPKGFWLKETDNSDVREHELFTREQTGSGPKVRSLGRLREARDGTGILAFTPRAFTSREFETTADAIRFLARHAGIKVSL